MSPMLPARWDLEIRRDGRLLELVEDVEALARGAIHAERWTWKLEVCDEAELLGFLLGEVVILEPRYSPRDAGSAARAWLFERLRFRARDWARQFYGRHGQHRTLADLPRPVDHDDPDWGGAAADRRAGADAGSHGAPGEVAGDRGHDGEDALGRLLEDGDRRLLREIEALGLGPPPGARGRSAGARRALERLEARRRARVRAARSQVAA